MEPKLKVLIAILTSLITVASLEDSPGPIVSTSLGQIEGFLKQTVTGRTFVAFEGVPYARPPLGKYRFKESIPPKPWTGVWKANTMFKCIQYDHLTPPSQDKVLGDEDCLYVNVYTPSLKPAKKLDVLVYIHGGAFMFGYGGFYGPEIILDRNVIFVNFNYRLGPMGFLSTEDDVLPGNNGLKDQVLALKWVKDNIEHFGGNPDSITIHGLSAGGASVEFHYLIPQSKGLFNRGISQSGSVLDGWVIAEKQLEKAGKLARLVGCPWADSKQIVDCLKKKPARQITGAVKHFQPWLYNPFSPFGVAMDYEWATDPLLPDHPYNLLKTGKVQDLPWITSYVSSEGLYPGSEFYTEERIDYIDKNWNKVMPFIMHYNDVLPQQLMDEVSQKIRYEYFKNENLTKETFSILTEALSDRLFVADIEKAGKLHSAAVKSPVYSYFFSYRGAHSFSDIFLGTNEDIGVSHADDTIYVTKTILDTLSTEKDRAMSKIMVDMFTSFMKTGKPNTTNDWQPLSKKTSDPWLQLHLAGPEDIKMETKEELGRRSFWDKLPFEENEKLNEIKDEL